MSDLTEAATILGQAITGAAETVNTPESALIVTAIAPALVAAIVALGTTWLAQWFSARRMRKQLISEMRQEWTGEVRLLVADIMGMVDVLATYHGSNTGGDDVPEYMRVLQAVPNKISLLRLYLNPHEAPHSELVDDLERLHKVALSISPDDLLIAEFKELHEKCTHRAKSILKFEWERIKKDS